MISYHAGLYQKNGRYYVGILSENLYDLECDESHGCLFEISELAYHNANSFDDKYRKGITLKVYDNDILRSDDHVLGIKISKEMLDGTIQDLILERLK